MQQSKELHSISQIKKLTLKKNGYWHTQSLKVIVWRKDELRNYCSSFKSE